MTTTNDLDAQIADSIAKSLSEIPHPSKTAGTNIYGATKVFPDFKAEQGETYFTLIHGIPHESSVSFVAVLQATRALRKGFESAIYLLQGRVETRYGEGLKKSVVNVAGDFLFIPPDVPHQPVNLSDTEPAIAIVARNDPNEQEHVVVYPDGQKK